MRSIESIPNASRTFEALRNLGYDLNSSIADVVDNAITEKVKARNVTIQFELNSKNEMICRIQDDGSGMSRKEVEEAMRLGTESTYNEADLGKFGMGMKTASLSHCNKLTVISKQRNGKVVAFCWDLKHVKKSGQWTLFELTANEIDLILRREKLQLSNQGTIVLWDDLFSINREYNSFETVSSSQNYFYRKVANLKLHLRMVYHRFLDGCLGTTNTISINVNGELLTPWDPFYKDEKNTLDLQLKKDLSQLKFSGYSKPVIIEGYVLPSKEGFSSEDAWKEAKGLLSWNDSQGYYIYRANRIIRFGGWNKTKAKDEHDKLARISIDIDSSLDELFGITVNKTKVHFPELLFHHLKNKVNPVVVKKAKGQYNKSEDKVTINNNFRKKGLQLAALTKELVTENRISTKTSSNSQPQNITVVNPSGSWLSNKINEFLKYGSNKDFELISERLKGPQLWKILCDAENKFKVIINASHPFYTRIYRSDVNKQVTDAIDALIFSLAFAELYNRNNQNAELFDTYKEVCSNVLERLINEKII
jgi:hypothetical protein